MALLVVSKTLCLGILGWMRTQMPEPPLYGLFGTGGFARPVMPILRETACERHAAAETAFIDDVPVAEWLNGVRVMSTEEFLGAPRATTFFNVALADPHARMAACERNVPGSHTVHQAPRLRSPES